MGVFPDRFFNLLVTVGVKQKDWWTEADLIYNPVKMVNILLKLG